MQMCPEGKDLIAYLFLEAIDERRCDDHHRHTQRNSSDSYSYDKGRKRPGIAKSDLADNKELGVQTMDY